MSLLGIVILNPVKLMNYLKDTQPFGKQNATKILIEIKAKMAENGKT